MGQKKEESKTKVVENKNDIDDLATIVLKLDLHCEGCAKKVKRSIRHLDGVEDVKADYSSGKLTVKGNVDPLWLLEKVANKTKKKVDLLSAQPNNDGGHGGGDKNSDEKKAVEKNADHKMVKEPQVNTVVMKIQLHCDRCSEKVKRIIQKIEGVQEVSVSLEKDLVTVKGTMDTYELTSYLNNKLKRNVDVVLPKKDGGGGGRAGGAAGIDKNNDGESEVASIESKELSEQKIEMVNKMEYYGSNANTYYAMPMYNHQHYMDQDYGTTVYNTTAYVPPSPPPVYLNAPQMFSDENPNGCSVM